MNTFGNKIKVTIFGQSHSDAIGVTIDGLPSGFEIDMQYVNKFMARRSSVSKSYATPRKEADIPEFISGLYNGKTAGCPLTAIIRNTDIRSKDYSTLSVTPRPSHVDFPAKVKFGYSYDVRGSGQFSGRMTAPLCLAGAVIMQILEQKGIHIGAHVSSIGNVRDDKFDLCDVDSGLLSLLKQKEFPVINDACKDTMIDEILKAAKELDSIGGIVECAAVGLNAGVGEPMFEGIENVISSTVFAIPAVRGIEFGLGFESAFLNGSKNNDSYYTDGKTIKTKTNNSGGIIGGMTTGMPIVFRVAFKPTPSIAKKQETVNLDKMENTSFEIKGRHDPCIVPRAVPCVEAACALALAQFYL